MIDVSHVWKKSYILESTMWMSIINVYDRCPINMNMMDAHHLWIYSYMLVVHHLWIRWMSIMYDIHTYWILDASHICMMDVLHISCFTEINFHHMCERPSWFKQWNLLVGELIEKIWWILKYICNWWNRKRENVGNMKLI